MSFVDLEKNNLAKYGILYNFIKKQPVKEASSGLSNFQHVKMRKNKIFEVFGYKILVSDWSVLNFSIFSLKAWSHMSNGVIKCCSFQNILL